MLVKDFPWNIPFLEAAAKLYVGRDVCVRIVPGVTWRGEAGKHGGIDTIKIGGEQPLSQFVYSFWHEVAHCCLHQMASTPDSVGVNDISESTKAVAAKPSDAFLMALHQRIQREEAEADTLAHRLELDHWKRCGPLTQCARIVGPLYA